jgi:hypothetical protein
MAIFQTVLSADTLSIEIEEISLLAGDKLTYKITDVTTSGVLYENIGYATDSFASPDILAEEGANTATLTILLPTAGGDIQISSKRLRSSVVTPTNYANQKTGEEIPAAFTSTVDCVLATLKVVDTSVYPTLTTNFSAQVVFTYPSAVVAPETVTSTTKNDTYEPTYLYTGVYGLIFSGSFTVQLGTLPYITLRNYAFSETGTKSVTCNSDICKMRCTVAHLRDEWQKSGNIADWNKWITASALLSEAIVSLYYCGKDITDLVTLMDKYDCGCGDCTEGTPTLILPR